MSRQREILGKFGSKSGIFQHCQSFKNSFSRFFLSTLKFSYQPSKLINPEFQEKAKKKLINPQPILAYQPSIEGREETMSEEQEQVGTSEHLHYSK